MKQLLATVLLAAACGSAPRATNLDNAGGRAIGPAPKISWTAQQDGPGAFDTVGFPAIAADGSRVLIADEQQDAGETPPNLTLCQIDRNDQEADCRVVLAIDDPTGAPATGKVDESNAYLANTNQQYGWTALASTSAEALDPDDGALEDGAKVTSGSIVITYKAEHLTVTDAGKVVFDKAEPGWAALPQNVGTDMQCGNPDFLEEAYVAAEHRAALVEIAYKGTDSCWEPSPELHLISW